ncbi:MAG TPA: sulfite exporter TauE/SafE family protein [Solirubrobacteraceae bacterium]|nr:sulfite exporter TauE/SafE family protein [Solirubrobacteraceae bacterium]
MTIAAAALAVLVGAGLQSATGFGFAMVTAPILFGLLGPQEAVSAGALLGIELSSLTLATERRVPRVLAGEALGLVAWSVPGLVLGAVALRELPDRVLSVCVAVCVLGALGLRLRARATASGPAVEAPSSSSATEDREDRDGGGGRAGASAVRGGRPGDVPAPGLRPARPLMTAAAGLGSGALSTATSLSGPPLILLLVARRASPEQLRDTLAAVFVALAALSAAVLLVAGTFVVPRGLVALLAAALAGQVAGRRGFALLGGERHERAVLVVLALTAIGALVSSLL